MIINELLGPLHENRKRIRHTQANQYCGMKAIVRELLNVVADQPMRIKDIATQISRVINQFNTDPQFSAKTIQKRVYDVCLVLKSIGLLNMMKKRVQLTIPPRLMVKSQKSLNSIQLSRQLKFKTETIKRKKYVIYKLHEAINLFRILKRAQQDREKNTSQQKIFLENGFAVKISRENIFLDVDYNRESMFLVLRNPSQFLSSIDLLSKAI